MIGRRAFIAGAGVLAVTGREAWAQVSGELPHLALIDTALPVESMVEGKDRRWDALIRGLVDLGHVEGQTIAIDRWTAGGAVELLDFAHAVVTSEPDVIVCAGRFLMEALADATVTIPIVDIGGFTAGMNYARPGGNVTGIDMEAGVESFVEDMEVLTTALPAATRIGYLATQRSWDGPVAVVMREAAGPLGAKLFHVLVEPPITAATIRAAFSTIAADTLDALYVNPSAAFTPHHALIGQLALEHRLPSMSGFREQAEAGGLISFGINEPEMFRRGADYVDRILDGGHPGEMAIERSFEFEIVINLRTAATLGITLPPEIMLRATEFIQ